MVMAAAQGWRWLLAFFQDALKVERGRGDGGLEFSLAGLVSLQANLFRASGSREDKLDGMVSWGAILIEPKS